MKMQWCPAACKISCCHVALGHGDDISWSADADQLIESLPPLSYIKDMKCCSHATCRIFSFRQRLMGGQGVSWPRHHNLNWNQRGQGRLWGYQRSTHWGSESRFTEIPHYRVCGSFQIHWGSFCTWARRHNSTWEVTVCVWRWGQIQTSADENCHQTR